MQRRTYNNMVKATEMIVDKGYAWNEANEIAIECFDQMEESKNGMSVEWFIDKIEIRDTITSNDMIDTLHAE